MTPEQFVYWLQGALEVIDTKYGFDARQVQVVRDHLALVFERVTPARGDYRIVSGIRHGQDFDVGDGLGSVKC